MFIFKITSPMNSKDESFFKSFTAFASVLYRIYKLSPSARVCLPKGDKITNMYISFPLRKYHFHMSKYQFQSKFVEVEKKIVKIEYKFVEVELKFVEVELKFVEVELKFVEVELKFVEVEVEIRRSGS